MIYKFKYKKDSSRLELSFLYLNTSYHGYQKEEIMNKIAIRKYRR
ncbi:hypothetical protein HMPREF3222_00664 [Clostridium perfringens]|uniref:Uncharacterized protein n=1 Tax=Clostridium perfringens TaxID=1502 RepID=A0A133NCG4_CLOPF|nr:hypothetical protein HMPREF3222_00664 [Clostridium perfringens]